MINKKSEIFNQISQINHIGFIMDGNRRYSKKQKISLSNGYKIGMNKFLEFVSYQVKHNIYETSFFALSNDNYKKRDENELKIVYELINFFSNNEQIEEFFKKNKIKINLIGDISKLEKYDKTKIIKNLRKKYDKYNSELNTIKFIVNIALNYGGQAEIVNACKQICKKVQNNELKIDKINEKTIKENLWFNKNPAQIIVRPGNAPRISGFMLFNSAYSEIYFTKKLWPELDESDFISIIDWYKNLKRNFGK